MLGADDVAMGVLFFLAAGYSVTFVVDRFRQLKNMREYETSFVKLHGEIIRRYQENLVEPIVFEPLETAEVSDEAHSSQPEAAQQADFPDPDTSQPSDLPHFEPIKPADPQRPVTDSPDDEDVRKIREWTAKRGFIKLELQHHDRENLLSICRSYYSQWMLNRYVDVIFHTVFKKYDPKVEIQFIAFQKIKPPLKPVPIEVIRCNKTYAIIGIGDKSNTGYLLKVANEYDLSVPGTVFNIRGLMKIEEKASKQEGKTIEESKKMEEPAGTSALGETSAKHGKEKEEHAEDKVPSDGDSPTQKVARADSSGSSGSSDEEHKRREKENAEKRE